MSTYSVETKRAIELQRAASDAYRLARDTRDADPALAHARRPLPACSGRLHTPMPMRRVHARRPSASETNPGVPHSVRRRHRPSNRAR